MLELDSKAPIPPRLRRYGGRVTNQDNLLVCFDKLTGYHWLAQEGTHRDLLTWKGGISLKTLLILICLLDFRNIPSRILKKLPYAISTIINNISKRRLIVFLTNHISKKMLTTFCHFFLLTAWIDLIGKMINLIVQSPPCSDNQIQMLLY